MKPARLSSIRLVRRRAVLEQLDLADHASLHRRRHVVVNDANAAEQSHGDCSFGLGDRVHRRRDQRQVEHRVAGQARLQADVRGREVDVARLPF